MRREMPHNSAAGGTVMKKAIGIFALAIMGTVLFGAGIASASTCEFVAQKCIEKRGVYERCFAPSRMNKCEKTGTYVAPNGNKWPAARSKRVW